MAKAVLIMDMPPKSCAMCDFVKADSVTMNCVGKMYCGVPWIGEDVTDYIACRPEFCPLRELPERKPESERRECEGSTRGTWQVPLPKNMGWNACLEEIIKEENGKC